MERQLH